MYAPRKGRIAGGGAHAGVTRLGRGAPRRGPTPAPGARLRRRQGAPGRSNGNPTIGRPAMPGSTNSVLRYRWPRAAPTARGIALARHASRGSAAVRPGPFPLCVAVVRSGNPASRRRPGVNVCRQVAHQIPETVKHRPLARPAILLERARRDAEPFGGLGRGEKHRCRFPVILLLLLRAPPDDPGTHVRQSNSKQHRWGGGAGGCKQRREWRRSRLLHSHAVSPCRGVSRRGF